MTAAARPVGERFGAACLVAVVVGTFGEFLPPARAGDLHGVELAWRNDPRPAADAPLPVEPPPRRPGRRAQRRAFRRPDGDLQPTPRPEPIAQAEEAAGIDDLIAGTDLPVVEPAPTTAIHRDQAYGDHPRQRFDIHLPDGCSGGGMPLVVWIHGPDWRTGSKTACPVDWLVERGYAVASVEYRPSDLVVFPGQLDDCREALAAIRADAATWGIDPARICVAGNGGGGHLAALLAYAADDTGANPEAIHETATAAADSSWRPAAVAAFDAPTHLPSLGGSHDRAGSAASRLVGGPLPEFREAARRASPLVHVSADAPPTLIVQSVGDGVPAEQGRLLDAALDAAGIDADLVMLDTPAERISPLPDSPPGNTLLEFLDRTLGPGPTAHED